MADAKRDQNDIAVTLGVSSTDSITPIMLRVDSVTGYLLVVGFSDSITATAATKTKIDQNDRPTAYGVSSVDGVTLVPIRTDTNGRILIENV